jgi:hypothetical protein
MPKRVDAPRDIPFHFRLSGAENAKLGDLAASARMTKSEAMRYLLNNQAPLKPNPPARSIFDNKALVELSRIGNNINQIAKSLNAHDRPGVDPKDFREVDRALLQLCALVLMGPEKAKELADIGFKEFMPYIGVKPSFTQSKK